LVDVLAIIHAPVIACWIGTGGLAIVRFLSAS
jgi:hypothetical protein